MKITPNTESVVVKGKDVRCFTKAQYHGEYRIRFPRNRVSVKDGKIESVCNIKRLEQE